MELVILWEKVINYGYLIRKNSKDGLESWNLLKKLIPEQDIEWTDKSKKFYKELMDLGVNGSETPEEAKMTKPKWRMRNEARTAKFQSQVSHFAPDWSFQLRH